MELGLGGGNVFVVWWRGVGVGGAAKRKGRGRGDDMGVRWWPTVIGTVLGRCCGV